MNYVSCDFFDFLKCLIKRIIAVTGATTTTKKIHMTTMTEMMDIPEMINTSGIAMNTKNATIAKIAIIIASISFPLS